MKKKCNRNTDPIAEPVMRTPRSVDLEITSRCNLRCKYCYFFDNPEVTYRDLTTEEWLQFIDELGQCGVMDVCLVGGEPFIRDDLRQLIEGIVKNRMRFSILSNGGLIDDTIASFIAETKRCNYVQVSVDGSSAEIHDTCRGKGSFDKAVRGIKILQKHKISVTVRVTLHRDNIKDLENTARLLLEELNIPQISTNAAGYFGTCQKNSNDLLLTVEDRQIAMQMLLRLEKKYAGRIKAQAGPLAEAHYWSDMEKARSEGIASFDNGGHLTGCGCPSSKITVRSDGTIVPCTMLAHMELGYINLDKFSEVWQKNPSLNNLRQRDTIPLVDFEFCSGCRYMDYCTGNCPGLAFSLTGRIDHPSPDACLKKYLAEGGKIPVIKKNV
jgi:SynChlorMet cassette radical SAM/SPASM protein ScmE